MSKSMSGEIKRKPGEERKPDSCTNSDSAESKLREFKRKEKEMGKMPLRINDKTVVMVKPEKCNPEYAQVLRERFGKI